MSAEPKAHKTAAVICLDAGVGLGHSVTTGYLPAASSGSAMQLLVKHIADAVRAVDRCGVPFKHYQPGVGPYGEPQLVKRLVQILREAHPEFYSAAKTCRVPDVLVPEHWALEFKIVRPFGDDGREAEHWSQNLLHPYPGNISAIGDALKLMTYNGKERKGVIVIAYEHEPPKIDTTVLVQAFELVARQLLKVPLSERHTEVVTGCVHPVHQRASIHGWELLQAPC